MRSDDACSLSRFQLMTTSPLVKGLLWLTAGAAASKVLSMVLLGLSMGQVRGCVGSSPVCVGAQMSELASPDVEKKVGGMIGAICGPRSTDPGAILGATELLQRGCNRDLSAFIYSDGKIRTVVYLRENRVSMIHRNWENPIEL
jgi:hypothetical protein